MKYFKNLNLLFVVFLTGASVLIIEIVATRILSPYFGNTIFTFSSIIGIILAALSTGYYFGGKIADKYPSERIFYSIILIGGLSVVVLHYLILFVLPFIAFSFPITTGPIVSAIVLFFIPSSILGTLSPFAIKLQEKRFPEKGIGSITGAIFFWSTFGSIFGSLFAGFVLVPKFGINQIIISISIVLILLGLLPLIKIGLNKKITTRIILFSIFGIFALVLISQIQDDKVVYSHDGIYEKIVIYEAEYEGQPTRFFQQDRTSSAAMFINSDELVYDYSKYYALYKIFKPDLKNILIIGGGAYSLPKVFLRDEPNATIDVSEIEPRLYELAQEYFNLPKTERLNNYTDDGRRLLYDTDKKYDLIFGDVFRSLDSIPAHFTTQEFFDIAKSKLSDDGIFMANIIGDLSRQEPSFVMSEIKTFKLVFPNSYYFAVVSPGKLGPQNIIFVGYNSDKKIDFADPLITGSDNPIIQSLGKKIIDLGRFDFSEHTVLTDNFSPVDYLITQVISQHRSKTKRIDGDEVLALIKQQLLYEARHSGTTGHKEVQKLLIAELDTLTQETRVQTWQHSNQNNQVYELTNIIGRFNPENKKRIILATHYDGIKPSDKNLNKHRDPASGANDPSSGVAIILEATRAFANAKISPDVGIDVVFFDGKEGEKDNRQEGGYTNLESIGSTYFAEHLNEIYGENIPIGSIVLDMGCNKNLKILKEHSSVFSAGSQTEAFWNIGKKIDNNIFIDKNRPEIKNDHTALNQVGIPSFLIIGGRYRSFNTTKNTTDKCSTKSLEAVANAVLDYIYTI